MDLFYFRACNSQLTNKYYGSAMEDQHLQPQQIFLHRINRELTFLDTLVKLNNGKICVLVYRKPRTLTNTYTKALTTSQVTRKVFFPPCLKLCSIITNKHDINKENAEIKHVLKKNGYQESIISKIYKRITNNYSLSWSQQLTHVTDAQDAKISICINLLFAEDTGEILQHETHHFSICKA